MFGCRGANRLVCCVFLQIFLSCSTVWADQALTVAIDKAYAPYTFIAPTGRPAGLYVEMWQLWSAETGIPVTFVSGTWGETLQMLKDGRADVHSGLFASASRSDWLAFSSPIHSIKSALFYRDQEAPPQMEPLRGVRIGVLKDTFQNEHVRNRYPGALAVPYPDHKTMLTALACGGVDFVFDEVLPLTQAVSGLGWQGLVSRATAGEISNAVRAAVPKGREDLLAEINAGFKNLNPVLLASLERRWILTVQDRYYPDTAKAGSIKLSEEERGYLARHKTISLAATPHWPPFEIEDPDGSYAGISADFIRLAAAKVGMSIEPRFDKNWSAHVDRLKQGQLDAAPGLNETPQRLEHFSFTVPYIEYYSAIFTNPEYTNINSPEDLTGKTVALERGYAIARNLPTDRPDVNVMLVDSTQKALEAVSSHKADAYIGNQVVAAYLIKKFTLPSLKAVCLWRTDLPGQLRFAVRKDNGVLRGLLQKGLDAISRKEREAILSTYIDVTGFQQNVFSLTQEQWAWLKSHPTLELGVVQSAAPLEFIDGDGALQGISSEYVNFIADKIKAEMKPTPVLDRSEAIRRAGMGELNLIPAMARTPQREKHLLFTEPYIEFPVVVFSRKDAPLITGLADIVGENIAVVEGSVAQEYLTAEHSDLTLVPYPSVLEAVDALAMGKADWLVNDVATAGYVIDRQAHMNLKVATTTDYVMSVAMAVPKTQPELCGILNKALGVVSEKQAAEFKAKWLALKFEHGLDMKTVFRWALPIAAGALLIIVLVVLWNRKLGGEIAERVKAQAELAQTLESLDEKNSMLEGLSSKLAKYLSPQVYDSIFSGSRDVTLSTERKKLTVFFSDIKNFTQTTDDMQPEDLTALLNSYFTEMSAIALEYGATIDKFIGDAMLMFFGDPESKGVREDAELCVRMALAMQNRMVELEREWHALGYEKPFKMRIGINTGYCNVGNFGSESRMDYTIIGGEVNLAARLEGQADPGGVLISSETQALVSGIVVTEERPTLSVKGIRKTIQPHAVLGLRGEGDSPAPKERTIVIQEEGVNLSLRIDSVPRDQKEELAGRLEAIARQLKS